MKENTILFISTFIIVFLCVSIINVNAQSDNQKTQKSLTIQLNEDKTVKRVEAVFTRNLTLDSLVRIKKGLQVIDITVHYKKIEFDRHDLLVNLVCEVVCNDGSGARFETGDLSSQNRTEIIGFYRDYTRDSCSTATIGLLDKANYPLR
ncbi:hypothetical protein DF185_02995 [Marinifilum breve]|uniref:Uncharacterized protein n=1 Tax=Marinifilum breve TaxID=2184082 RepID=A0A2V4A350_9BACT|nr:hypothetical protein [Marinifilum breve]PXY03072.1 hypothetical protein DF185_02995 [Marinifilum breve]